MTEIDKIIKEIREVEQIDFQQSFEYSQISSKLLRNEKTESDGRKIIINIIDNWIKLDKLVQQVWIDLIEMEGFYPYLDVIKNFTLESTQSKLRKELSKSKNLSYYLHDEQLMVKIYLIVIKI